MSSLSGFIGGSYVPKYQRIFTFQQSTTWSPPQNCKAIVTVIGGGGSGAIRQGASTYGHSTGGGAGGLAQSAEITLDSGTTYTVTAGAGGASAEHYYVTASTTTATDGNDGGNSSFSGTGITTLTGNGGSGGTSVDYQNTVSGGAGGTASGGSLNYTGGAGGSVTITSGIENIATGGGAVNITGTAYNGGDVSNSSNNLSATGGGGTGGDGYPSVNGGGIGGPAGTYNVVDFIDWFTTNSNSYTSVSSRWSNLSTPVTPPDAGMGAGGNGYTHYHGTIHQIYKAQNAGIFGGGGSYQFTNAGATSAQQTILAGKGGNFGGGGGGIMAGSSDMQFRVLSGAGGDGVIFVAVTEWL